MAESETLNRRQLLTALLGWQVANSVGCGTSSPPPAGELTHTRFDVGHLLRDGVDASLRPQTYEGVGVTIVGGGIAGLAAAWRLKRAGFDDFRRVPSGLSRSISRLRMDFDGRDAAGPRLGA